MEQKVFQIMAKNNFKFRQFTIIYCYYATMKQDFQIMAINLKFLSIFLHFWVSIWGQNQTDICFSELGHHCFRKWFAIWSVPSHFQTNTDLQSIRPPPPPQKNKKISEPWIKMPSFSCKKQDFKMLSAKCWPCCLHGNELTLVVLKWNIPAELGQYQGCWCPGSLYHQAISSHGIDYER